MAPATPPPGAPDPQDVAHHGRGWAVGDRVTETVAPVLLQALPCPPLSPSFPFPHVFGEASSHLGVSLHAAPWLKCHRLRSATDSPAGAEGSSRNRGPALSTSAWEQRLPCVQIPGWLWQRTTNSVARSTPAETRGGFASPGLKGANQAGSSRSFQGTLAPDVPRISEPAALLGSGPSQHHPNLLFPWPGLPPDKDPLTVILGPARRSQTTAHPPRLRTSPHCTPLCRVRGHVTGLRVRAGRLDSGHHPLCLVPRTLTGAKPALHRVHNLLGKSVPVVWL